jgi:hypothetical protein
VPGVNGGLAGRGGSAQVALSRQQDRQIQRRLRRGLGVAGMHACSSAAPGTCNVAIALEGQPQHQGSRGYGLRVARLDGLLASEPLALRIRSCPA